MRLFPNSCAALAAAAFAGVACGNQLSNAGFETPALAPNSFLTIAPGAEPVGFNWLVTTGNVDIGSLPLTTFGINFNAFEGAQGVDLNGTTNGGIRQDFITTPGLLYQLQFAYCDNPVVGGVDTASVNVNDVTTSLSLLSQNISHGTSTGSAANWTIFNGLFIATSAQTRLTLLSTSPDTGASGGLFVDAFDVSVVPEPTALAAVAVGAMMLKRRSR